MSSVGALFKTTKAPLKCLVLAVLLLQVVRAADEAGSSGAEASLLRAESGQGRGRRTVRSERRTHEVSLHPQERQQDQALVEVSATGAGHVLEEAAQGEEESPHGHSLAEVSASADAVEEEAGTTLVLATAVPPTTTAEEKASTAAGNTTGEAAPATNATTVTKHEVVDTGSPILSISALVLLALCCGGMNRYYREKMTPERPEGEERDKDGEGSHDSDTVPEDNTGDIGEDVYAAATMSIIRDLAFIAKPSGSKHSTLRWCRIAYHLGLLFFSAMCQFYVLKGICMYGMPDQVLAIRQTYDAFENHMYAGKIYKTENGYSRGIKRADFDASRFETLDEDIKTDACRIPFSEPDFLAAILFLWVAICVGEMRQTYTLFDRIILNTERSDTMADALKQSEGGEDVVVKLTTGVKAFLSAVVLLPRFIIALFLVWVGCRWLSATNDFGNLVFNGVGLEFVLLTKDFVYKGLVSDRAQRETTNMKTLTLGEDAQPTPVAFLGSLQWGALAICWVYLYIYSFQRVLPQYRWDVNEVCHPWRIGQYNKKE